MKKGSDLPVSQDGRPTELTAPVQATICDALRRGCYYETAAALAGISVRTLRNWLRAGARAVEDESNGRVIDTQAARGVPCCMWTGGGRDGTRRPRGRHGEKEWTAHAWRLERRWPEKYGRRERVNHDHALRIRVGLDAKHDLPPYDPQAFPVEIAADPEA